MLYTNVHLIKITSFRSCALHCAAFGRSIDVVKFLMEHGANDKATNKSGDTPFDIAVESGHSNVVEYFLPLRLKQCEISDETLR